MYLKCPTLKRPVLKTSIPQLAKPDLGDSLFAPDVKNVLITEQPSLGHAALEL
jgi:hypothetical protein